MILCKVSSLAFAEETEKEKTTALILAAEELDTLIKLLCTIQYKSTSEYFYGL